jgi:hypothetical protein
MYAIRDYVLCNYQPASKAILGYRTAVYVMLDKVNRVVYVLIVMLDM